MHQLRAAIAQQEDAPAKRPRLELPESSQYTHPPGSKVFHPPSVPLRTRIDFQITLVLTATAETHQHRNTEGLH